MPEGSVTRGNRIRDRIWLIAAGLGASIMLFLALIFLQPVLFDMLSFAAIYAVSCYWSLRKYPLGNQTGMRMAVTIAVGAIGGVAIAGIAYSMGYRIMHYGLAFLLPAIIGLVWITRVIAESILRRAKPAR